MRRAAWAALAAVALLALGAGCGKGGAPARVTELVGLTEVERGGEVIPAHAGTELFFDDLVRTGDGAWARVRFASGQTLRLGERTLLRLGRDARSSAQISVAVGEAEIEGAGDVTVATPRGPARLDEGARLRVRADQGNTRLEVLMGRAIFGDGGDAADGGLALAPGEGLAIAFGGAVIERYRVKVGTVEFEPAGVRPRADAGPAREPEEAVELEPAVDAADALPPAEPAEPPGASGSSNRSLPEPTSTRLTAVTADASSRGYDVVVAAGEGAIVHAERAPVAVRLRLPAGCDSASARLRWSPRRPNAGLADGPVHMLVDLPAGTFRYRLFCTARDKKDVAHGSLIIRRDSGAAALPRTAPHNRLDADGRRYTVLFQNHLPAFSLSWPRLTGRAPYTLVIESRGQDRETGRQNVRKLTARRPTYQLRAGALPEGNHTWYWRSADGQRSPTTTLSLRFDNAALAAEIQLPRPGKATPAGDHLDVKGVTLPGSRVSVNEGPLPVDAQGRFRAELTLGAPPPRTIAIRVDHPRTGTHHYLRRLRASR